VTPLDAEFPLTIAASRGEGEVSGFTLDQQRVWESLSV